MKFPNSIQCALLFDRRVGDLETVVKNFMRVEQARSGAQFNIPEANPGLFYRLYGGDDLMITVEYIDNPANIDVFRGSLTSYVTGMLCANIRERLMKSRSHVLINVSHGVMGGIESSPEIMQFMQSIGRPPEGHSLPQFQRRLDVCALIARIVSDHATPGAVHWTQSDMLLPGEKFDAYATGPAPGPLHIHPFLFGDNKSGDGAKIGIRTFGMRHFIGYEVLIEPSILPWAANYETILAMLRVATMANGYIIPDGDTFGPEDHSLSYRVIHHDAKQDDVPLLEMVPLMFREYGFVTSDYVPRDRVINDKAPPLAEMPTDDEQKMELVNEWREKRALAEGVGGSFEVRTRNPNYTMPPPQTPAPGNPGIQRRTFGRKMR